MAFNWNGAAYDITMSLSFRKWKKNVTHSTFTRFHGNMLKAYTVSCTGWAEVVDVCRPQRDERFGFPGRVLYLNWIEVHARSRSASDSVHVIRSVRGKLNYRWVFWLARAKEEHKCSSHFLPFVLSLGGGGGLEVLRCSRKWSLVSRRPRTDSGEDRVYAIYHFVWFGIRMSVKDSTFCVFLADCEKNAHSSCLHNIS